MFTGCVNWVFRLKNVWIKTNTSEDENLKVSTVYPAFLYPRAPYNVGRRGSNSIPNYFYNEVRAQETKQVVRSTVVKHRGAQRSNGNQIETSDGKPILR